MLAQLVRLFPAAEIFTLLHVPGSVGPDVESRPIHTSPLQWVPGVGHRYRTLLPLMPAALRFLDLRGFDLVISSSHCVAKGARVPPGIPHLAYVHSPMRYMWDQFEAYFGPGRASLPVRLAAAASRPALQAWDRRTAADPDVLVANSHHVARRIAQFWGREAEVIHPPVDLARFGVQPPAAGQGGYFLWLGRAGSLQASGRRGGGLPADGPRAVDRRRRAGRAAAPRAGFRPTSAGCARCRTPMSPSCTGERGR